MNKSENQKYWFKQQYHVWQPISWQGWVVVTIFLLVMLSNFIVMAVNPYSNGLLWLYLNILFIAIASLLVIGSIKGPSPKN